MFEVDAACEAAAEFLIGGLAGEVNEVGVKGHELGGFTHAGVVAAVGEVEVDAFVVCDGVEADGGVGFAEVLFADFAEDEFDAAVVSGDEDGGVKAARIEGAELIEDGAVKEVGGDGGAEGLGDAFIVKPALAGAVVVEFGEFLNVLCEGRGDDAAAGLGGALDECVSLEPVEADGVVCAVRLSEAVGHVGDGAMMAGFDEFVGEHFLPADFLGGQWFF